MSPRMDSTRKGVDETISPVHLESPIHASFRGALLGLTIGDAVAFPVRGRSRDYARTRAARLEEGFEQHESGFYPRGQYTDDSQTALCVARAIIENGAVDPQTIAEHLAPLWRDQLIIDRPAESTEAMECFITGRATVRDCGRPVGALRGDALARVVPIGLWCHADPELASLAAASTAITHRDPRALAAAAGTSAAVAYVVTAQEIVLGAFLDRVARAAGKYHGDTSEMVRDFPRMLSITEYRVFEELNDYVQRQAGEFADSFNDGVPDNALFLFMLAIYYFLKSPFDLVRAWRSALGVGGEVTTLCALVGALVGGFLGEDAAPSELADTVHESRETLMAADDLFREWERTGE